MDYRETLNLPRTAFPMRAGLPQQEPERLRQWQQSGLYDRLRQERRGRPAFVLHDGPPYANGEIHMGTTLNKVLKDMINRYYVLEGRDVVYVPGYDTHGLPIEIRALKQLGISQHQLDPVELRRVCRDTALHFIEVMSRQFQRLGVLGDWDHPYRTLDPEFEAHELRLFARLVERGLIYKDFKAVYWCPVCETALAEAEIEYHSKVSPSIWVTFPIIQDPHHKVPDGTQALIWTTTPWTIPANVAIAYHPDLTYVVLETDRGRFLVAEALAERVLEDCGLRLLQRSSPIAGQDLVDIVARHPYLDQAAPLVPASHVTADQGTGLVHTAPGHGTEDFEVGKAFGLPVVQPLDDRGRFVEGTPYVANLAYSEAESVVLDVLRQQGHLLHHADVTHQYAHCWRSKNPVIYRATEQWFFRIAGVREELLQACDTVDWIPDWGLERMRSMVVDREDWCISRQRTWGVPIPALVCEDCRQAVMSVPFIEHFADVVEKEGAGVWWEWPLHRLLPPEGLECPCGSRRLAQEWNVFDVWLDSGSTQAAVLTTRPGLTWPADVVLEGADQFRGWFNSLLTTAVGWRNAAPYRSVVTHGWVVDAQGRPMHKSLGNVMDPFTLVDQFGADVVRLWVASSDFRGDVRVSMDHMRQVGEVYRKVRNTFRYILGNLADWDSTRTLDFSPQDPLDIWALTRLGQVLDHMRQAYRAYEFHVVVHELNRFCTVDLSNFYLDVIKDRLYTLAADDPKRRGTQAVLAILADALVRIIVPILPFTAEEIWEHLPDRPETSVHGLEWPLQSPIADHQHAFGLVEQLLPVREVALGALEEARRGKVIGNALEADLTIAAPDPLRSVLDENQGLLVEMLMVASIQILSGPDIAVTASRTQRVKCVRCWRYLKDLSQAGICSRCEQALRVS